MPSPIIKRGTCHYCQRPVIWGLLQNGRWRTFQAEPIAAEMGAAEDRFAVSRSRRCVVDLLGVDPPPSPVLVLHLCVEYAEARRMRGVSEFGDELATWVAASPTDRTEGTPSK